MAVIALFRKLGLSTGSSSGAKKLKSLSGACDLLTSSVCELHDVRIVHSNVKGVHAAIIVSVRLFD